MAGVGVPVAREVGAELGLVMHLVPDDRVALTGSARRTHRENEPTIPRYQKQPQNLQRVNKEHVLIYDHLTHLKFKRRDISMYTLRPFSLSGR